MRPRKQTTGASGTTNHAALSNLGYNDSGHTGFANSEDLNSLSDSFSEFVAQKAEPNGLASLDADEYVNQKTKYLRTIADPGSPTPGEIWINAADIKVRDNAGTPQTRTLEIQSNKNVASGYMGLQSTSSAKVAQRTIHFAKTKTAWTTAVAVTVSTEITANSDYIFNLQYWLEKVTGGANRKSATWRHLLRRTGGTLSILNNGEVGSVGGFAPTQAWSVSGDNLTWTITSAGSDGYVSHFRELLDCSDMTVA